MAQVLTALAVERAKPDVGKRIEIPDGGLPSFYLVVQPSGAKSWAVRYRHGGKPKKLTVGTYPKVDLKEARDLARKALTRLAHGVDPGEEKAERKRAAAEEVRAERDLVSVQVDAFIERYAKANTRPASWRMTERLLRNNVVPAWGTRRIQEITRRDVVELLDKVVDRGAPIMANRLLAATRRMFGWLRERGVVDSNPCEGVKAPAAERSRDRVLSDDELRLAWRASQTVGQPFGPMVRVLMLTGQRLSEVAGMSDREIEAGGKLWTIPRERAKNDVAHPVPLSDAVAAELASVKRVRGDRQLVFSTTGATPATGYSNAKERLDAEMLRLARDEAAGAGRDPAEVDIPRWTFHDLRRTMASGMARLGINLPVIEKVLNHVSGSFGGIVGVYQRHTFAEEKRTALEAWARFVVGLVEPAPSNAVRLAEQA